MKQKYEISGMSCSACQTAVDHAVRKLKGVSSVEVSLLSNSMNVEFNEEILNNDDIIKAVNNTGYKAYLPNQKQESKKNNDDLSQMKKRLIASFVFMIILMYISMSLMFDYPILPIIKENGLINALTQLLLVLPIIYLNQNYFINGFKMLIKKTS